MNATPPPVPVPASCTSGPAITCLAGDQLREQLAATFRQAGAPFSVTGIGTLLAIHATAGPVTSPADLVTAEPRLLELAFLDLLEHGYYLAPRGYLALSLALSADQLAGFVRAVEQVLGDRAPLWSDS